MGPIGNSNRRLVAEINVTPLVDVMLVLLIIFMITAPMMTQGVDVELPETTNKALSQEGKPIIVAINGNSEIFIGKTKTNQALLRNELEKLAISGVDRPIFLKADKQVPYGLVVSVMADIKDVGFDKLGMITRPKEKRL